MPKLDLLLLPLLGGYWFLNYFKYTKYYHQRIERQRLIFNSSITAILISLFGFLFDKLILKIYFLNLRESLERLIPFEYEGIEESFYIFILSPILAFIFNLIFPKKFLFRLTLKKQGNQIEKILWSSLTEKKDEDKLLMITTSSNKVYVGYINKIQKPIGESYVSIIPYFSGYREKETQKLIISTDYFSAIESFVNDEKVKLIDEKMGVVINKSNIALISKFDIDVFEAFQLNENDNNTEPPGGSDEIPLSV